MDLSSISRALAIAGLTASYVVGAHADPVTLTIRRQHEAADCVSGQLSINGKIVAYTVERPYEGNLPVISSIPSGIYGAFIRTNTKDRWRVELRDVPGGRKNIQLHVGNFTADSVGCILLGRTVQSDLCTLVDSKQTFDTFKIEFNLAAGGQPETEVPIKVVITDI